MKLTVNLTVKTLSAEKTAIRDNGLQAPLMIEWGALGIALYGIKNCNTVKKARAWLDARGVAYEFHDYKTAGVDRARLERWCRELGWETLVNRAGTTFRKLPDGAKDGLDAHQAIALMLAHPSVIKRPVLESGGRLSWASSRSYTRASPRPHDRAPIG